MLTADSDAAQLHHQIADRSANLALTCAPAPGRILPWPAETFDLVVGTTSFDHWAVRHIRRVTRATLALPNA